MNMSLGKQNKRSVYGFVVEFIKSKGYSPSIREICKGTGIMSTATVRDHLNILKENGVINMEEGKSRTISLVGYKFVKEN